MQDERLAQALRKLDVAPQHLLLPPDAGAAQRIKAALPHRHRRRMAQQRLQGIPVGRSPGIPRMYPHGILAGNPGAPEHPHGLCRRKRHEYPRRSLARLRRQVRVNVSETVEVRKKMVPSGIHIRGHRCC